MTIYLPIYIPVYICLYVSMFVFPCRESLHFSLYKPSNIKNCIYHYVYILSYYITYKHNMYIVTYLHIYNSTNILLVTIFNIHASIYPPSSHIYPHYTYCHHYQYYHYPHYHYYQYYHYPHYHHYQYNQYYDCYPY